MAVFLPIFIGDFFWNFSLRANKKNEKQKPLENSSGKKNVCFSVENLSKDLIFPDNGILT